MTSTQVTTSQCETLPQPNVSVILDDEPTAKRIKVDLSILTKITKNERKNPVFHFTTNDEVFVMDRKHASTYSLSLKCVNSKYLNNKYIQIYDITNVV